MSHKKIIGLAIFYFFFFYVKQVNAATYYVSTNGNDSNNGTSTSSPWRTIQKASNTIMAGDTAIISAGKYTENVTISKSGSSSISPITFRGVASPIISSATKTNLNCLSLNNACLKGTFNISGNYVRLENLEIIGPNTNPSSDPGVKVSGDYVNISNNFIHNTWGQGIYVGSSSSNTIVNKNTITYTTDSGVRFYGQNHLIEGNTIKHTISKHPYDTSTNYVDADGIRYFGSNSIVRKNIIKDIYLDESPQFLPHSDCFQSWNDAKSITFDSNYCELTNSEKSSDPMVKFNMLERNSCTDSNTGNIVQDITFKNNIFVSNSVSTRWVPLNIGNVSCSSSCPIKNIKIYNNTFVAKETPNYMALLIRCTNGLSVKNNIFYDFGNSSYSYINMNRDVSNYDISHNNVYKSDIVIPRGGAYPGDDISSIWLKNPLFSNLDNYNFHLTSKSPPKDRGINLSEVSQDFDENTRPIGSNYDIGAYEYTSTSPSVTQPSTPSPTPSSGEETITVCKTGGCNYYTIQSAIDSAKPGDIIEVSSGTYNESININKSGNSNNWYTLRSKIGNTVWLDGINLSNVSNIDLNNSSFWKIIGLKLNNAGNGNSPSCTYTHIDGVTVGIGGHDILVQNLEIKEPSGDGIDLEGNNYNIQVLDNEVYDMRKDYPCWEGDGHGIHMLQENNVPSSHDIIVQGNYVHDAHGKACLATADFTNLGDAKPTNIVFENNYVKDCTNGIKVNTNGIYRYNLVVDTGKYSSSPEKPDNGYQAFTHDYANNVTDMKLYNNTVVGYGNSYGFTVSSAAQNQIVTVFKNNIAYNPRNYYVRSTQTNFIERGNNLYYGRGTSAFSGYSPQGNSIYSDPLFTPLALLDYTLSNNSPAIDKGDIIYSQQLYSGSYPDIGAFEYGITSPSFSPSPTSTQSLPGDANKDGLVDMADYVIWFSHYNSSTTKGQNVGDFNKDGRVDGIDYIMWLINY